MEHILQGYILQNVHAVVFQAVKLDSDLYCQGSRDRPDEIKSECDLTAIVF